MTTLPVQPFLRAYLMRAAGLWVGVRLMLAVGSLPVGAPLLNLRTAIAAVALVSILALIDARRRGEHLFLANLGVSGWMIAVVAAASALLLEALLLGALAWI